MHYIITVPHGKCSTLVEYRSCDMMANIAADTIINVLRKNKRSVIHMPANHYRVDVDLNRFKSRVIDYRRELFEIMKVRKNNAVLLDVHSFPKKFISKEISFYKPGEIPPEFVIIKPHSEPTTREGGETLGDFIYYNISNYNVRVKILQGNGDTDIINDASSLGIPTCLLEFNEALTEERIREIAKMVGNIVRRY